MMIGTHHLFSRGSLRASGSSAVVVVVALVVAVGSGCGASSKEVKHAERSAYDVEFPIVYTEVTDALAELYPALKYESAVKGVLVTKWHPLKIRDDNPRQTSQGGNFGAAGPNGQASAFGGPAAQTLLLIRFRVSVAGGRPWRVRIEGLAGKYRVGENSLIVPLRGADRPGWLQGRINQLRVSIHRKLSKYAVVVEDRQLIDKPQKPVVNANPNQFDELPQHAAVLAQQIRAAAVARDYTGLRAVMVEGFVWSLGGAEGAEQAIIMWQADTTRLEGIIKQLDAGCATLSKGHIVCPTQATGGMYEGPKLVLERDGGGWKFASFVTGAD